MANTQPIGVTHLIGIDSRSRLPEHWYWCRQHKQAAKVGESCQCYCGGMETDDCPTKEDAKPCVRVGPFMSEIEANRLGETQVTLSPVSGHYRTRPALGMEVEE